LKADPTTIKSAEGPRNRYRSKAERPVRANATGSPVIRRMSRETTVIEAIIQGSIGQSLF
jgi:hypothetical protein